MLTIARQGDGEDELDLGEHSRNVLVHLCCPQLSCFFLLLVIVSFSSPRLNKNFNRTLKLVCIVCIVRRGCVT